jgi:hypothetical protein
VSRSSAEEPLSICNETLDRACDSLLENSMGLSLGVALGNGIMSEEGCVVLACAV